MQAAALHISSEFCHDSFSEPGGTMCEQVKRLYKDRPVSVRLYI